MSVISVPKSKSISEALHSFMSSMDKWWIRLKETYNETPPTDVHDQLTYLTGLEPYFKLHPETLVFLNQKRDEVEKHFTDSDQWYHGYWRMQEAHHGTEHYELFLGMMARLEQDNEETIRQVVDVAEHIGNWNSDIDSWYNEHTKRFYSLHFGSDGVRQEEKSWIDPNTGLKKTAMSDDAEANQLFSALNMPDHLRFVNIALIAYQVTHDTKYLSWADEYALEWARPIVNQKRVPVGLTPEGPIWELSPQAEELYRSSVVGMIGKLDNPVDLVENLLASGGINAFLELGKLTKNPIYRSALEVLLDVLISEVEDPDAGPAIAMMMQYRKAFNSKRYDKPILDAYQRISPFHVDELHAEIVPRLDKRPSGIGKRKDLPVWYEDEKLRIASPILLGAAAEILNDEKLATQAIDLAHAYMLYALANFTDGHEHGCKAQTISAIARGHGRDNHAGMTTAVLEPLIQTFEAF